MIASMRSSKLTIEIDPESPAFQNWLRQSGDRTVQEFESGVIHRISVVCDESARIVRCLVLMPDNAVTVVMGIEPPYDFELGKTMAELDIVIARDRWHYFRTMELPCSPVTDEVLRDFGSFAARDDD